MADMPLSLPQQTRMAEVRGVTTEAARRRLALWLPVAFGIGIASYFALAIEPSPMAAAALALVPALLALVAPRGAPRAAATALTLAGLGFGTAALRTASVAAPVLAAPVSALVEGRVREITQSAGGLPRLTLDGVTIYGVAPEATPVRVRVTLRRPADGVGPGAWVSVLADLAPPGPPVAPGAFDFRRAAWFERLGAIGTARSAVALIAPARPPAPAERLSLALDTARAALSAALRGRIEGEAGAFAAAIVTGDRSGLPVEALDALRDSSLAHLLAISGLHLAIVCGLVFGALRLGLALLPGVALRWPVKAIAALAALGAALAYLALSGGAVATQRAFLMAGVALGGVLAGRPALGLRGLAAAALVVLVLAPESLLSVGFQMSFAATLALLALYEAVRGWMPLAPGGGVGRRLGRYAAGLLLTSAVAGLATAPFSAWHFHRLTPFGLLANLAAVPAMGLVVAPALAVSAVLAPIGWEEPTLRVAAAGIGWILEMARIVAALPGAVQPVAAAGVVPLGLLVSGGLWLCLVLGAARLLGALALLLGLGLWAVSPWQRPALLVAPGGALVALRGPDGLVPDHPRAAGYVAERWLRRDGDMAGQADAAARPAWVEADGVRSGDLGGGWTVVLVRARSLPEKLLNDRCRPDVVIVAPRARIGGTLRNATRRPDPDGSGALPHGVAAAPGGCLIITAEAVAQSALALYPPRGDQPPRLDDTGPGGRPWQNLATGSATDQ